ncbi:hypothetical protein DICPUDRAFT_75730 [Dictyostelium purpureum]|uniref:Uncharacterized protein n=1 Tax=Dictyostelium purpureum TaxID=5786 RepID=F0ZBI2_DICPU|nr:uncharacterized protein DICPUDRAFT_75730 [Dictyostelium purpureum]EGC38670.1 hypothetical protein DICPUDRAFT_75730 [Dictyostelium purpureum]|eukprot:XP_003284766.1 hypothetical protein DICPUDRAFT_75730 [Dictyostelium purpureum]
MERDNSINNRINNLTSLNDKDLNSIIRSVNLLMEHFQRHKEEVERYKYELVSLQEELNNKNQIIKQLKEKINGFGETKCEIKFYKDLIYTFEKEFIEFFKEKNRLYKEADLKYREDKTYSSNNSPNNAINRNQTITEEIGGHSPEE